MATIDDLMKKFSNSDKKVKEFSDLLDALENTKDKKKMLWREIYENAVVDRQNAYMLFTDAYTTMQGGSAEHVTIGATMAKYLERMNKANDQILKLAELIAKEEQQANQINPDDLFAQIQDG